MASTITMYRSKAVRCKCSFMKGKSRFLPRVSLTAHLRYLCLLAVLCHPSPPPLVCIEEPELGLHPDVLPTLAELLKEAATRTQLIVTTHSDVLAGRDERLPWMQC